MFESSLISFWEDLVKFGFKPPTKTFYFIINTKKILQNSHGKLFLNASLQVINLWHGYGLLARKSSTAIVTQPRGRCYSCGLSPPALTSTRGRSQSILSLLKKISQKSKTARHAYTGSEVRKPVDPRMRSEVYW